MNIQKISITFICLFLIVVCKRKYDENILAKEKFDKFINQYEKQYSNKDIYQQRFQIFKENLKIIEELNQDEIIYNLNLTQYGVTKFTDLSIEEFEQKYLLNIEQNNQNQIIINQNNSEQKQEKSQENIPINFDWRNHGAVTRVMDQGSVGTCWAISAVGNIEGVWKLHDNQLINLSVEQVVECDSLIDSKNYPNAACGVFGGWPYLALQYVQNVGGIASDIDYPYCVGISKGPLKCRPCSPTGINAKYCGRTMEPPMCDGNVKCRDKSEQFVAHISGWKNISQDEDIIQQQLLLNGPLSAVINGYRLQFYKSGIWNPKKCKSTNPNHAILIVGYGEQIYLSNEENQGEMVLYWTIKNSWGEDWGEDGYFKILRGEETCGINQYVVTAYIDEKQEFLIE